MKYCNIAAIEHTRCQHKMTNNNVVIIQDSRRGENKIAMRMRGCYSNAKLISFEKKAKMSTCEQSSVQCDSHKFLAFNMSSECRNNCRVCPALFIHKHLMLKTYNKISVGIFEILALTSLSLYFSRTGLVWFCSK